jgi:hypothetical protein
MNRAVLQRRLAEAEEQIASGLRQLLGNARLSPNWKAMATPPAMPNICLLDLNYCRLLGGIAGPGS